MTYTALLGGVIAEHPFLKDRYICHEPDVIDVTPNFPAHMTEATRFGAAVMWLAGVKGIVIDLDCQVIGPATRKVTP